VDSSLKYTITLLYTAHLRGDLEYLPQLYTYLREVRLQFMRAQDSRVYLLDLGETCHPDVWHCAVTEGRSMWVGLDGMGYQAANVEGQVDDVARDRMRDNLLALALVDAAHPWVDHGLGFCTVLPPIAESSRPWVLLQPAQATIVTSRTLHLRTVQRGQVGVAQITLDPGLTLLEHAVLDVPPTTPPDPTIAGAVDFIRNEARYRQRKG
jgi:hypothetical protein